ncbi:hypothetical protein BV20DRAFT_338749 [Pilatotrama ljubarskyi]|nr:hypothetical protein BV20DRAFT_338749 [Pilatotrama ljubarskyi]
MSRLAGPGQMSSIVHRPCLQWGIAPGPLGVPSWRCSTPAGSPRAIWDSFERSTDLKRYDSRMAGLPRSPPIASYRVPEPAQVAVPAS